MHVVYLVLCSFITWVDSCNHHHIRGTEKFHPHWDPLCHTSITKSPYFSPLAVSNLLFILSFKDGCINGIIEFVTFWDYH